MPSVCWNEHDMSGRCGDGVLAIEGDSVRVMETIHRQRGDLIMECGLELTGSGVGYIL